MRLGRKSSSVSKPRLGLTTCELSILESAALIFSLHSWTTMIRSLWSTRSRGGGRPGTLHLMEADLAALGEGDLETHDMNPVRVLAAARRTGVRLGEVYLLGCEPAALEGMGLSEPVKQAVHPAVDMIERLIHQLRARKKESYES